MIWEPSSSLVIQPPLFCAGMSQLVVSGSTQSRTWALSICLCVWHHARSFTEQRGQMVLAKMTNTLAHPEISLCHLSSVFMQCREKSVQTQLEEADHCKVIPLLLPFTLLKVLWIFSNINAAFEMLLLYLKITVASTHIWEDQLPHSSCIGPKNSFASGQKDILDEAACVLRSNMWEVIFTISLFPQTLTEKGNLPNCHIKMWRGS